MIDKINNWNKPKGDLSENITPIRWTEHFIKLLNSTKNTSSPFSSSAFASFELKLDRLISLKEMNQALYWDLKKGKASGPDGILLEYLRVLAEP